MASSSHLCFSPFVYFSTIPYRKAHLGFTLVRPRICVKAQAMGTDILGDFGARDPFPAEIESKFGEKVLGNVNTEHKILIPRTSVLGLSREECIPVSDIQQPMSEEEAKQLLLKVVGWRLINDEGVLKLQSSWKVRDSNCGAELMNRIQKVVEGTGHSPTLHFEEPNQVRAELWTAPIGGLSRNDFIIAAKLDEVKASDLAPRKRAWA